MNKNEKNNSLDRITNKIFTYTNNENHNNQNAVVKTNSSSATKTVTVTTFAKSKRKQNDISSLKLAATNAVVCTLANLTNNDNRSKIKNSLNNSKKVATEQIDIVQQQNCSSLTKITTQNEYILNINDANVIECNTDAESINSRLKNRIDKAVNNQNNTKLKLKTGHNLGINTFLKGGILNGKHTITTINASKMSKSASKNTPSHISGSTKAKSVSSSRNAVISVNSNPCNAYEEEVHTVLTETSTSISNVPEAFSSINTQVSKSAFTISGSNSRSSKKLNAFATQRSSGKCNSTSIRSICTKPSHIKLNAALPWLVGSAAAAAAAAKGVNVNSPNNAGAQAAVAAATALKQQLKSAAAASSTVIARSSRSNSTSTSSNSPPLSSSVGIVNAISNALQNIISGDNSDTDTDLHPPPVLDLSESGESVSEVRKQRQSIGDDNILNV